MPHAESKSGGNLTRFIFAQFSKQTIKTISFLFGGEAGERVSLLPSTPPATANSTSQSETAFFGEQTFNILPIST